LFSKKSKGPPRSQKLSSESGAIAPNHEDAVLPAMALASSIFWGVVLYKWPFAYNCEQTIVWRKTNSFYKESGTFRRSGKKGELPHRLYHRSTFENIEHAVQEFRMRAHAVAVALDAKCAADIRRVLEASLRKHVPETPELVPWWQTVTRPAKPQSWSNVQLSLPTDADTADPETDVSEDSDEDSDEDTGPRPEGRVWHGGAEWAAIGPHAWISLGVTMMLALVSR